jgi:hypothetical protein
VASVSAWAGSSNACRPVLRLPFAGVRWGSRHARADTLANLADRRVALLEELDDVDTGADLARLVSPRLPGVPSGGA